MKKDTPELLKEAGRVRDDALARFQEKAFKKYNSGQREHGGLITRRVDFDDLEDEIIDLWYYLQALREKIEKKLDDTEEKRRD